MVMKTKDIVSAGLVTVMTIGAERVLNKYSKNKLANSAAAIGGSFLALEYLRSNGRYFGPPGTRRRFDVEIWSKCGRDVHRLNFDVVSTSPCRRVI